MDVLTELAVAARRGDHDALVEFIGRTQADVRRMTAHLVDPDRADDVAQETYIRAIRALPGYRGDAAARTWLLTICRAACADAVRRSTRQRRLLNRVEQQRTPRTAADPSGLIDIEHLVADLDDDRRAAFVLTQMLGLRYDEAAEVCGVAVGTIRSRVARARAQLIRQVRDDSDDAEDVEPAAAPGPDGPGVGPHRPSTSERAGVASERRRQA